MMVEEMGARLKKWVTAVVPLGQPRPALFIDVSGVYAQRARLWAELRQATGEGGSAAVADWIVPGSHLRGKKGRLQRQAGEWLNAWRRFAGLDNLPAPSLADWRLECRREHFLVREEKVTAVNYYFSDIAAGLPRKRFLRARAMLIQAPAPVVDYLTPQLEGDRIAFRLKMLFLLLTQAQ